ncbi:carboxypeptidase regulatory-like domain-containing protein [Thermoproteota archaeon]
MGYRGIDRKWMLIALIAVLIAATIGLYYFVLRPTPRITGIMWQRSGGFAGLEETLEIEPDGSVTLSSNLLGEKEFTLSETEWNNLLSVIENSGFTGFEASYKSGSGVADFFTYSLTIERGSSTKRVEWVDDWASESELPDGLKDIEEHILSIIQGTEPGGVEGSISDELGRPVAGLIVSIVDGSVGFPEIAVLTREDGFYQIGSVPPGVFTLGAHDEKGELLGQKTFQIVSGETSTVDITLHGFMVYDYYGGLDLFEQGIYVISTDVDPKTLIETEEYTSINDFWSMLKNEITQNASTTGFISILISRGDFPTGGYLIQLKSYVWLESYPVVCFFTANFTDPGEGVAVTEALTNPLVLVPMGKLPPGSYVARVHIDSFIMTYDSEGDSVYTPVETLVEEVWETVFEVS